MISMCDTTPSMRSRTSFWKPFITDSTMISAATPERNAQHGHARDEGDEAVAPGGAAGAGVAPAQDQLVGNLHRRLSCVRRRLWHHRTIRAMSDSSPLVDSFRLVAGRGLRRGPGHAGPAEPGKAAGAAGAGRRRPGRRDQPVDAARARAGARLRPARGRRPRSPGRPGRWRRPAAIPAAAAWAQHHARATGGSARTTSRWAIRTTCSSRPASRRRCWRRCGPFFEGDGIALEYDSPTLLAGARRGVPRSAHRVAGPGRRPRRRQLDSARARSPAAAAPAAGDADAAVHPRRQRQRAKRAAWRRSTRSGSAAPVRCRLGDARRCRPACSHPRACATPALRGDWPAGRRPGSSSMRPTARACCGAWTPAQHVALTLCGDAAAQQLVSARRRRAGWRRIGSLFAGKRPVADWRRCEDHAPATSRRAPPGRWSRRGVHPLLARLYAARGVLAPDELDDGLARLLPPARHEGPARKPPCCWPTASPPAASCASWPTTTATAPPPARWPCAACAAGRAHARLPGARPRRSTATASPGDHRAARQAARRRPADHRRQRHRQRRGRRRGATRWACRCW